MVDKDSLLRLYEDIINSCDSYNRELYLEVNRLRDSLTYYARGEAVSTIYGEDSFLERNADSLDISMIDGEWKTGRRARAALEDKG